MRHMGLNDLLSGPFWKFVYGFSETNVEHSVNGQSVGFLTGTFPEFMRFRNLAGERVIIGDLLESVKQDDIFYDIGANVGTYTCFIASQLGSKQTIAFEPEPRNASRLRENLNLNKLNAEIIEMALSDSEGKVNFTLNGDEIGEGEHAIATAADSETIEVETARGDSVIHERELPWPTVIKVDVEGAELSVLRGMRTTLADSCRLVYVEVHPKKIGAFGGSVSEVRDLLEDIGFKVVEMDQREDEFFLRGTK